jgi:aldehyde dehydrogenase (NAD+)
MSDNTADFRAFLKEQRAFYHTGSTLPAEFRLAMLDMLRGAIKARETDILAALAEDLGKPAFEAFTNEIGILYLEIRHAMKNLRRWMRPERTRLEFFHLPGSGSIHKDPYGSVLIMAPWNYPFQLLVSPLIGAIAGGNTAILKPSELAPATARVFRALVESTFDPSYLRVVEGGPQESMALMDLAFDKVFFTGSVQVGKQIMASAARHLTPITLELGGKSPAIVDASANLEQAAKKITWGKFNNSGQTCVAPDYVLVHESVAGPFKTLLSAAIREFYGEDPVASPHYGRIINTKHHDRLTALLAGQKIHSGGRTDREIRYIEPTIVEDSSWDSPLMQDEIFGPILPVLAYTDLDEVEERIRSLPKPLALYVFTRDNKTEKRLAHRLSFGGGGVNSTILQVASSFLPFGGVGHSGMGHYHGKASFEAFTHRKSILRQPAWHTSGLAYPGAQPSLAFIRKVLR